MLHKLLPNRKRRAFKQNKCAYSIHISKPFPEHSCVISRVRVEELDKDVSRDVCRDAAANVRYGASETI